MVTYPSWAHLLNDLVVLVNKQQAGSPKTIAQVKVTGVLWKQRNQTNTFCMSAGAKTQTFESHVKTCSSAVISSSTSWFFGTQARAATEPT